MATKRKAKPSKRAPRSNVARGMAASGAKGGPMRDRRLRRPEDARAKERDMQADEPIMDTCSECHGLGETQAECEICAVPLTVANLSLGEGSLCVGCAEDVWN